MAKGQQLGLDQGKGVNGTDKLALFLKVFSGQVLEAFERKSVMMPRHTVLGIQAGKSAQFPVIGRTKAAYLKPGESLADKRKDIKHTEKVITIDGLLTDDVLIFDIENAMNHYDVQAIYTAQLGESLAMAADGAILAELAGLCNLEDSKNENIAGLGSPSVLAIGAEADLALPAKLGEAILQYLTIARAKMSNNYVSPSDRSFYTKPDYYSAILAALMPQAANYQALIDPETGSIRNVMGFEVVEVPHLTSGGAGIDREDTPAGQLHGFPTSGKVTLNNVVGLFMHRSAVGTVKLRDLSLEHGRNIELQADQIVAKYAMGHGGLRPEAAGALVFGTASTPEGRKLSAPTSTYTTEELLSMTDEDVVTLGLTPAQKMQRTKAINAKKAEDEAKKEADDKTEA